MMCDRQKECLACTNRSCMMAGIEDPKLGEECGVFGMYDMDGGDVASSIYYGLFSLQHRGQESCGIAVSRTDGEKRNSQMIKGMGLVNEVFDAEKLEQLHGDIGVGHVRYSTAGASIPENTQPLVLNYIKGTLMVAHNGNLVNAVDLRRELELMGAIFHTSIDSEVIAYLIARERLHVGTVEDAVKLAMQKIRGAYSLVVASPRKMIGARDPFGFHPLCIGKRDNAYFFSSESCALDSIGARFIRDVEPGEIIIVDKNGAHSLKTHCGQKTSMCVFEYVYIARPDSVIEGSSVHQARLNAGKKLWQESPVEADVVVGVPDSGLDAALGFSMASGIPYGVGFIKNRYVGRTFIQPSQSQRSNSVRIKLNVIKDVVKGKRVVLIDDSIVRGTTSARIVNLIREAGATEVHMRISSPPFTNPCYFGIDIDSKENLIACQMSIEEIAKEIGADSLGYLSIEGVKNIAENAKCNFCTGCFTGEYPIRVPKEMPKDKFERKIDE